MITTRHTESPPFTAGEDRAQGPSAAGEVRLGCPRDAETERLCELLTDVLGTKNERRNAYHQRLGEEQGVGQVPERSMQHSPDIYNVQLHCRGVQEGGCVSV